MSLQVKSLSRSAFHSYITCTYFFDREMDVNTGKGSKETAISVNSKKWTSVTLHVLQMEFVLSTEKLTHMVVSAFLEVVVMVSLAYP